MTSNSWRTSRLALLATSAIAICSSLAIPAQPARAFRLWNIDSDSLLYYSNLHVAPGDVLYLAEGYYVAPIAPLASGTPGSPITYIGASGDRDAVSVDAFGPSGTVRIKWVRIRHDAKFGEGARDSLYQCSIGGSAYLDGPSNSRFEDFTVGGPAFQVGFSGAYLGGKNCDSDTIVNCSASLRGDDDRPWVTGDYGTGVMNKRHRVRASIFKDLTMSVVLEGSTGSAP